MEKRSKGDILSGIDKYCVFFKKIQFSRIVISCHEGSFSYSMN